MKKMLIVLGMSFFVYVPYGLAKLNLFTIASRRQKGLAYLEKSCAFHKIPLTILGLGKRYQGNWTKITYIYNYVVDMPDDEICMFIDGYDVLLLANEDEILQKFFSLNSPFIIGAEKNCWPESFPRIHYPQSPTQFRYINSGCLIGYAWAIRNVFKELLTLISSGRSFCNRISDQVLHHTLYVQDPSLYTLDYNCELFLNFYQVAPADVEVNPDALKIHYKPTHTWPVAFHGNGDKSYITFLWDIFFEKK